MKNLETISKDLMNYLMFALKHCTTLKKGGARPMTPFAVVIKGADKAIRTFVGGPPQYADQMFEKIIREDKPDYVVYANESYLIADESFLTIDDVGCDFILLKAYDKYDSNIYLAGQTFRPKTKKNHVFEPIGNPGLLGTILNDFNLINDPIT